MAKFAKGRERESRISFLMRKNLLENGEVGYFAETDEDFFVIRNTTIDQFVKAGVILTKLTHQSLQISNDLVKVTDKYMIDKGLKLT